jgi:hypothetical protein
MGGLSKDHWVMEIVASELASELLRTVEPELQTDVEIVSPTHPRSWFDYLHTLPVHRFFTYYVHPYYSNSHLQQLPFQRNVPMLQ